jgi:flavorubredoxin
MDEKIAVVDTVWNPFSEKFLENVQSLVDPKKIDFIVANHAEPDHSGSLGALMDIAPQARIIVSRKGLESIPGHFHKDWNFQAVKTGETLALGETTLAFVEAPMLHWPDSMFTYVAGRNLLLSNDAFGQHYATPFRYNDQADQEELFEEALKYYANILTPFSPLVTKKIEEVLAMGLTVDMIAPSHGVIWRKDPLQIVKKYQEWAKQVPERKAVILYDTMWHATLKMAEAIGEGLAEKGIPFRLFNMALSDRNDVLTEVFRAKAVIVGSPCLNGGLLPTLTPVLEDLKGLRFKNKVGAAFGSYGWSGENVKRIEKELEASGIPLVAPGVLGKWQPDDENLQKCRMLGLKVAENL